MDKLAIPPGIGSDESLQHRLLLVLIDTDRVSGPIIDEDEAARGCRPLREELRCLFFDRCFILERQRVLNIAQGSEADTPAEPVSDLLNA